MKSRLRIAPFLVFAALVVGIACGRTTPSPQATEVVGRTQEAVSAAASTFVLSYPLGSSVTTAVVDQPPFAGSAVGGCVAGKFRGARVPAFSGAPMKVGKSFVLN